MHILFKGVFIDCLGLGDGTTVVDSLGGEEKQACDVCSILNTQSDKGKGAQFGGQRVRGLLLDAPIFGEYVIKLFYETWL